MIYFMVLYKYEYLYLCYDVEIVVWVFFYLGSGFRRIKRRFWKVIKFVRFGRVNNESWGVTIKGLVF